MNNSTFFFAQPKNEPVKSYAPGSTERELLAEELRKQYNQCLDIPIIVNGKEIRTNDTEKVVMPTEHSHVLAVYHKADKKIVAQAIEAAMEARKKWERLDWTERCSVMLRAAELIAG